VTDELPVFSQAFNYIATCDPEADFVKMMGVLITLPTLEIYIQDIHFSAAMYDINCETLVVNGGDNLTGGPTANRFGEFIIQGVTFSILSGWVEIAPH